MPFEVELKFSRPDINRESGHPFVRSFWIFHLTSSVRVSCSTVHSLDNTNKRIMLASSMLRWSEVVGWWSYAVRVLEFVGGCWFLKRGGILRVCSVQHFNYKHAPSNSPSPFIFPWSYAFSSHHSLATPFPILIPLISPRRNTRKSLLRMLTKPYPKWRKVTLFPCWGLQLLFELINIFLLGLTIVYVNRHYKDGKLTDYEKRVGRM